MIGRLAFAWTGLFAAYVWCVWCAGCASPASVGRGYRDAGRPDLAVLYLARAYLEDPENPEQSGALREALELAQKNLVVDGEARVTQGNTVGALGTALHQLELATFAAAIGIGGLDPQSAEKRVRDLSARAAKGSVQKVDAAEARQAPPGELLKLLREAQALDPNNPELSARYEDLKRRMQRRVAVRLECAADAMAACRRFAERVLTRITDVRRELLVAVAPSSERKELELVVALTLETQAGRWQRVGGGKAEAEVAKMNKYAEAATDKDGKPLLEKVSARWELFESSSGAVLGGRVRLDDLREGKGDIIAKDVAERRASRAAYYTWDGDQRALDARVTGAGTAQTPPKDPDDLAHEATRAVADALAPQIIDALENLTPATAPGVS